MQKFRILSAVAFMLAASVTMGSIYVTVRAAAQVDEPALPLPADASQDIDDGYSYSVVLGPGGSVQGTVGTFAGTSGRLESTSGALVRVIHNGSIVGSATTGADGSYAISGLSPGVHSVLTMSDGVFAAFAFEALEASDNTPNGPSLETAAVSAENIGSVGMVLEDNLGASSSSDDAVDASDSGSGSGEPASGIAVQSVRIAPDGLLYGWVRALGASRPSIDDLTIYFIRDGETVGAAEVASDGRFVIDGLVPGAYAAVGAGSSGMFAVSLDVLSPVSISGIDNASPALPVGLLESNDVAVGLVPPSDVNSENLNDMANDQFAQDNGGMVADSGAPGGDPAALGQSPFGNPPGASGFPGGGAGGPVGGGGAPGVGGGSGLLAALAIGGVLYAVLEDDDDPASPSVP